MAHPAAQPAYIYPVWRARTPSTNTAVYGPAKALTSKVQESGMAGHSRDNALDHVVVVVFENRSLDNVLGRLYGPGDGKTL
jgi:phospholipase C